MLTSREPYLTLKRATSYPKRAISYPQKSHILPSKEPYLTLKRATSYPQKSHILPSKEPHLTLKRALSYPQKSHILPSKETHYHERGSTSRWCLIFVYIPVFFLQGAGKGLMNQFIERDSKPIMGLLDNTRTNDPDLAARMQRVQRFLRQVGLFSRAL